MRLDAQEPPEESRGLEDQREGGHAVEFSVPGAEAPERLVLDRVPAAYASLFAPCRGRSLWTLAYRCPWCSGTHFGRLREPERAEGMRRTRCGHRVWTVVVRTHGGT